MSGRYRNLITLQQRVETVTAEYGEPTITYTELAKVWAEIKAVSAREALESQQVEADVTHRITFAYATAYEALTPADRVIHGSKTYEILHILDRQGRKRQFEISARERI